MTNIIPFKPEKTQARACSFCKKPEAECTTLIKSGTTNHCICGECIVAAKKRLEETK
jgi:hypothetical protein